MSRSWALNEPVIHALVQRLRDQLPDRLATIAGDVGAEGEALAILQPPPAERILDYLPTVSHLTEFPTVGIGDNPTAIEDDTGSSATGRHELEIIVFLAHVDLRVLAWGLRRWTQAMLGAALDRRRLGDDAGWGVGTGHGAVIPGPTLEHVSEQEPRLMSWSAVRVWARRDEV